MGLNVSDIRAISRFAQDLDGFQRQTKSRVGEIEGQARGLGQKWRDEHYTRWFQQFERSKEEIDRFLVASQKYARHLQESAAELEKAERKISGF
jgi:uncharacterized protein YukE